MLLRVDPVAGVTIFRAEGEVLWSLAEDPALVPGSALMREWSDLNGLPPDDCAIDGLRIERTEAGTQIVYRHLLGSKALRIYGSDGRAIWTEGRVPLRVMPPGM